MSCRNYTGTVDHVLCREVYYTVSLFGRVHYQRFHCTACCTVHCAGKSCAFFMDDMSPYFGDEILQFFVPQVKLMLSSDDWKTVEAAVFGLGTVAEGVCVGVHG